MLMDDHRKKLVVMRDGEFIVFDVQNSINDSQTRSYSRGDCEILIESRRELLARPESTDDREQFLHLREYSWNAAIVIPPVVVRNIIRVVDRVEETDSSILMDDSDVYVMIPFGDHALFVGNVSTGWLRYLDFSHVEPLSESIIHHIGFSKDNLYIYLCCNNTLSLLSTANFQPIVTVPFTDLEYTVPVGVVRTPPEEFQLQMMMNRHRAKLMAKQNKLIEKERTKRRLQLANRMANAAESGIIGSNGGVSGNGGGLDTIANEFDKEFHSKLIDSIQKESILYQKELKKRLESISVIFASTRVFLDPRAFIYRFPINKCKVITTQVNSRLRFSRSKKKNGKIKRKVFDGTYLLDRHYNDNLGGISAMTDQATGIAGNGNGNAANGMGNGNGFMDGTQGNAAGGGWHYMSLKYRPWKMHNFGRSRPIMGSRSTLSGAGTTTGGVREGEMVTDIGGEDGEDSERLIKNNNKNKKDKKRKSKKQKKRRSILDEQDGVLVVTSNVNGGNMNTNGNNNNGGNGGNSSGVNSSSSSNEDDDVDVGMSIHKHGDRNISEIDKIEEELVHVALESEMELTIDPITNITSTTSTTTGEETRITRRSTRLLGLDLGTGAGAGDEIRDGEDEYGDYDYDDDELQGLNARYNEHPMFDRVGI